MFIGVKIVSKSRPVLSRLADMTIDEASKCGPYGRSDVPCVVYCGGRRYQWKSRRAARFFFTVGARSCDGSEARRYYMIADALDAGATEASDGIPVIEITNIGDVAEIDRQLDKLRVESLTLDKLIDRQMELRNWEALSDFFDKKQAVDAKMEGLMRERRRLKGEA